MLKDICHFHIVKDVRPSNPLYISMTKKNTAKKQKIQTLSIYNRTELKLEFISIHLENIIEKKKINKHGKKEERSKPKNCLCPPFQLLAHRIRLPPRWTAQPMRLWFHGVASPTWTHTPPPSRMKIKGSSAAAPPTPAAGCPTWNVAKSTPSPSATMTACAPACPRRPSTWSLVGTISAQYIWFFPSCNRVCAEGFLKAINSTKTSMCNEHYSLNIVLVSSRL